MRRLNQMPLLANLMRWRKRLSLSIAAALRAKFEAFRLISPHFASGNALRRCRKKCSNSRAKILFCSKKTCRIHRCNSNPSVTENIAVCASACAIARLAFRLQRGCSGSGLATTRITTSCCRKSPERQSARTKLEQLTRGGGAQPVQKLVPATLGIRMVSGQNPRMLNINQQCMCF